MMRLSKRPLWSKLAVAVFVSALLAALTAGAVRKGVWRQPTPIGPRLSLHLVDQALENSSGGTAEGVKILIRNTGTRRLIVGEDACASCSADGWEQPLVVAPQGSKHAIMQVGIVDEPRDGRPAARYTSNDPQCPRFSLHLRGGNRLAIILDRAVFPARTD